MCVFAPTLSLTTTSCTFGGVISALAVQNFCCLLEKKKIIMLLLLMKIVLRRDVTY